MVVLLGLSAVVATGFACLIMWAWRVLEWVWLRPKKIEKCLRRQGFDGNPYRLFYGDSKEMTIMARESNQRPIHLSDDIAPRVLPFHYHIINKYGKKSFSWIGPMARVYVMEPELIKEILVNNNVYKKPVPNPLAKYLVCGVSGYEDEKWAKHRRILNPAFYQEKLKCMLPAMHSSCNEMIEKWKGLMSSSSSEEEESSCELDVLPFIENLTSEVISRTAFGSNYEQGKRIFQLQNEQAELTSQILQLVYIPGWRFLPTKRNRRMKEINNQLGGLLRGIIYNKEKAMRTGEAGEDDDLLSILLKSNMKEIEEHGNNKQVGLTIEEVIEECKTFYFAGKESTSNFLVWTMVLLSMHPTWQQRAREEIVQVFNNNKPDFDGLHRLKVVTMILYEVLRLYPPVVLFTRAINKDTKLGNMTIPAGVRFSLPVVLVHHDHQLWGEDAKEFKPERFSEGVAKATNNRLSFFPFSWGPRICIGNNFAMMEAKLALAMILQHFSFELSPSYTHSPAFVVTLQPQNSVHLILRKLPSSFQ